MHRNATLEIHVDNISTRITNFPTDNIERNNNRFVLFRNESISRMNSYIYMNIYIYLFDYSIRDVLITYTAADDIEHVV